METNEQTSERLNHRNDIRSSVGELIRDHTDESVGYGRLQVIREIRNALDDELGKLQTSSMRFS